MIIIPTFQMRRLRHREAQSHLPSVTQLGTWVTGSHLEF